MSLKFYYGVIKSGKTRDLMNIYSNYTFKGMTPMAVSLTLDDKNLGILREYNDLSGESIVINFVTHIDDKFFDSFLNQKVDILLVDNVHLIDYKGAAILRQIANAGIPVVTFGLRTKYDGSIYVGAVEMLRIADRIEEVIDICWCGRRAIMSAAYDLVNYTVVRNIEDITKVGFVGVCHRHWTEGKLFRGTVENYNNFDVFVDCKNRGYREEVLIAEFGDVLYKVFSERYKERIVKGRV